MTDEIDGQAQLFEQSHASDVSHSETPALLPAAGLPVDAQTGQHVLFPGGTLQEEVWKGLPEFTSENREAVKTLYVHFRTREDYEAFVKLVGQPGMTWRTRAIWHPYSAWWSNRGRAWVDGQSPQGGDDEARTT